MDFQNFLQVAGVIDGAEAELLVTSGVQYLGFPLRFPVHRPDLSEPEAAAIIQNLRPPTRAVLITYLNQADQIIDFSQSFGASIVQLHGDIDTTELRRIKEHQPSLAIIKSLVIGLHPIEQLVEFVQRTASYIDAYITDTFDPTTGASGATGKTHDWSISRQLVEYSPRPVILAGGLTPQNVRAAILAVRPAGVDAYTGVEDMSGRKSQEKVKQFVREAEEAFRIIRKRI